VQGPKEYSASVTATFSDARRRSPKWRRRCFQSRHT